VNGNWQQECKGVYSVLADENMTIVSKNQMKLSSNSYENKTTFLFNDLSEGGSVKEDVKGNYEVRIQKVSSTFSVRSEGDIRTEANKCRYEKTDGNVIQQVGGKVKTNIDGGIFQCIPGGEFPGMMPFPSTNSYDINVASGDYRLNVGGNVDIDATEIYLN